MSSSAKRALRILDAIGRASRPLGVTDIARMLSLPPGTVFRSLDALVRADLIARYQASSRYVLGGAAERLRRSLIARFRMRDVVLPYLRQLASISGETASLHVRLGWHGLRIASAPGTAELTNVPPLGEARPLGEYYAGRAMLAFLGDDEITRYGLWAAGRGATDRVEIGGTRHQAFALGDPEFKQAAPIALPIRGNTGQAIAALAIEGPVFAPDGDAANLAAWREIAGHVEALARTQPLLFENPFGHLDPDRIAL